jgi:hypothetical protein
MVPLSLEDGINDGSPRPAKRIAEAGHSAPSHERHVGGHYEARSYTWRECADARNNRRIHSLGILRVEHNLNTQVSQAMTQSLNIMAYHDHNLLNPSVTGKLYDISNGVGRVKGVLSRFSLRPRTPMHSRGGAFPGEWFAILADFFFLSNLRARPVSVHRLGVAHQTSLRPLSTMMIYSNSLRFREAGSPFRFPVHCYTQASPHGLTPLFCRIWLRRQNS